MAGAVSSLLFTWGQTMVEVMKIMATSFKRSHACTAVQSMPPTLQQATTDPHLRQRLPDSDPGRSLQIVTPESEEELKSLLMKVEVESEKVSFLSSTFRKRRSWHLVPSLHG